MQQDVRGAGRRTGTARRGRAGRLALLVAAGSALLGLAATSVGVAPVGLPARVVASSARGVATEYPSFDATGAPVGTSTWRVVAGTGNCCENHLASAPDGTLYDFGGTYPHLSTDHGRTWRRVQPTTPLVSGEGTIAVAPNGDVVGIGWDPYSGDHLQAFKYDASTREWLWAEQPLHTPFYDRQWVAVVPGPVRVGGTEAEYAVVLRGGYPSKDLYLVSTDGLTYTTPSLRDVDQLLGGSTTERVELEVDPHADHGQSLTNTNLAPLGIGTILTGSDLVTGIAAGCSTGTYIASGDVTWSCYVPQDAARVRWQAADSAGNLHATEWSPAGTVDLVFSADGGVTATRSSVPLPAGYEVRSSGGRDLKAHAAAGVIAVTTHAQDTVGGASQDLVFVYRYPDPTRGEDHPVLERIHEVGLGDLRDGVGVGASGARFDFSTLAILPDGTIAVSFNDSTHTSPAVAVLVRSA
ncbi:MAG: hypothetical protein ACLGIR_01040 [Actinomycetes bacterium]